METDRNLLFGILALQMDFVTRDDLITGMNSWILEKNRTLGEILVERGALSAADRFLLEPLVRRHIEQHGNDPARSLESLSSVDWLRVDLASAAQGDLDVRESLGRLKGPAADSTVGRGSTASYVDRSIPAGSRFRILRFHAQGGLGEVFVAQDMELKREVAIKQIRDRHGDHPESRARFLLEAEITGGLEHPGIVPVYGLGHYEDGRPFYAMRFIRGDSLKEAIERFHRPEARPTRSGERMLGLQKLLRRFLDVCNAVAYAHSRGVLHRDIKPGNIMVGQFGETLVVDWGLAKVVGTSDAGGEATLRPPSAGGSSETLPGSAIGTPAFMSPEQAAGRIDQLGPASDVYSLGATLYYLLTGKAPIEAAGIDVEEILRRVKGGEFPPPRRVKPDVPRALEAICLKAMALGHENRYESPRGLAEDVERWLADEPVTAWREPILVVARRWSRRHRTLATTAAAVVLVGLVALGIAYRRESAFSRKLQNSNVELSKANTRESNARAESDRRLEQTFQAIEDYYTGVGQEVLLGQKEFQPLRQRLLEKPRQFYEQLSNEIESSPASDERFRFLLAKGRGSLGKVYHQLGRLDEARTQYAAGIALLDPLAKDQPARPEYQAGLATIYSNLGVLHTAAGEHGGAMESYREAIALLTKLAEAGLDPLRNQARLATASTNLGLEQCATGDHKGSIESHRQAIATYRRLTAAHPDVADYQDGLAKGLNNLALTQQTTGELTAAMESYRGSIAIWSKLGAERPDVPLYRHQLAGAHANLGHVQQSLGDRESTTSYSTAVAIWDQLTAAQPNVPMYQSRSAAGHRNLGDERALAGDSRGALEAYRLSLAIYARLTKSSDNIPEYESGLAVTLNNIGTALKLTGDFRGAATSYRQAIATWDKLRAAHPGVPEYSDELAKTYTNLGVSQHSAGELRGAMESYRQAIAIHAKLATDHPKVPAYQRGLALNYTNLGIEQNSAGNIEAAIETHREAIAVATRFVGAFPDSHDARSVLGFALHNLGESLYDSGASGTLSMPTDKPPIHSGWRSIVRRGYFSSVLI